MKILVTGAAGFLGRILVERLVMHGYTDIRCSLRRRASLGKLETISQRYPNAHIESSVGDLRYAADAARISKDVNLIFHLAAAKKGAAAGLFLDSVVASRNLLDAARNNRPLRIVLVS